MDRSRQATGTPLTESRSQTSSFNSGDTTASLGGALRRYFSGTMLSRITGLGRDASMAAAFGSDPAVAAFMVAFRFAHLLRRLLGEGALHAAFIPQFEALRHESPDQAAQFFRDLTAALVSLLLLLLGGSIAFLYLTRGFWSVDNREIVDLLMLMLPSALFICLFGLNSAHLQCDKRYFLPAVAPVAFNLTWIAGVFSCWDAPPTQAVHTLAWVVVFACIGQWLVTLTRVPLSFSSPINLFSPQLRKLVGALGLGIIGVGAVQLNSALDTLFARSADLSGPAYLWWAIRINQAPIGLFGVAMAGALLPPLSRAQKENNREAFDTFLTYALNRACVIGIPLTFAIWVGGASSVQLLYGRGEFDVASFSQTTQCLWGYSLGLLPTLFVMILAPAFYAQGNYRTPTIAACVSVSANIALNGIFVYFLGWGSPSVAVATSLSAWANCLYLFYGLKVRPPISWRIMGYSFCAFLMACFVAVGFSDASWAIATQQEVQMKTEFSSQLAHYLAIATSFGLPLLIGRIWK